MFELLYAIAIEAGMTDDEAREWVSELMITVPTNEEVAEEIAKIFNKTC